MQAVQFHEFGEPADVLDLADVPLPEPGPGEVRVRMLASPVNPSDLMTVRGTYGRLPELPASPGFEGVGVVDKAGSGLLPKLLAGKRVAALNRGGGNWAEYAVLPAKQAIPISKELSLEEGAMFFVNPATAYVMTRKVLDVPKDAWLVQTAAGSALGRMVIRLGRRDGFKTLNVVRRAEQAGELKTIGADAVVSFDPDRDDPGEFNDAVARTVGDAGVRYAIDPVGGRAGSAVVKCLGPCGRMLVYGTLSGEPLGFPSRALMTPGATIEGFWLTNWMNSLSLPKKLLLVRAVTSRIREGVLTAEVSNTFTLEEIKHAVVASEKPGRGGKVLLRIGESPT